MARFVEESVSDALERSIRNAKHLRAKDAAAVAAARKLARKIDAWDVIVDWAIDDADQAGDGARPKVPANDNTSLPTFLRFCESLGLTPAGRSKLEMPKEGGGGGKLTSLQDAARRRRAS